MLRVTDHVHVEYSGLVKLFDNVLWWHTDGANKQSSTRIDDDLNEVVEFALSIVVAGDV